jgi:hypothetical protein
MPIIVTLGTGSPLAAAAAAVGLVFDIASLLSGPAAAHLRQGPILGRKVSTRKTYALRKDETRQVCLLFHLTTLYRDEG